MNLSSKTPHLLSGLLLPALLSVDAVANERSLTPNIRDRVNSSIGRSAEVFSILGSNQGPTSGIYNSKADLDAELKITKFAGTIDFSARQLSDSVDLVPFVDLGIAFGSAENELEGPLDGDRNDYDSFIASIGGGTKFRFGDRLSISPGMGFVFAHTDNDYDPHSRLGKEILRELDETAVNWDANSISYVPNIAGAYEWSTGPVDFIIESRYSYYATRILDGGRDTDGISTDSQVLSARIAGEFPLGISVAGVPLRSELAYGRVQMFGDINDTLRTDYYNIVGAKILTRKTDRIPILEYIGVEGRYFWGDEFDGWSLGLTLSLNDKE